MSEYKNGDRVRVVIEDTVLEGPYPGSPAGALLLDKSDFRFRLDASFVSSVEKLPDPLPTTPGSVIAFPRLPGRFPVVYRTLHRDGRWWEANGTEPRLARQLSPGGWKVVYDAGKASS